MTHDPLRRCTVERRVAAETAIAQAIAKIEEMPADTRLSNAQTHLAQAAELVGDFVDQVEPVKAPSGTGESPEPIMQFFAWSHLPEHLQEVSKVFAEAADVVVTILPRNPERTVALRKLLEAKDAAVRARLFK